MITTGELATEGPDGSARTRADGRDRRGEPMGSKNEFFRGPDVFVVVGAEKKERLSWVLWEELRLPDVVIELTSPSSPPMNTPRVVVPLQKTDMTSAGKLQLAAIAKARPTMKATFWFSKMKPR